LKRLRTALLTLAAFMLLIAVALPSRQLSRLRSEHRWFGVPLNHLEHVWPEIDLVHAAMFLLLGWLTALALPDLGIGRTLSWLAAAAAASELTQYWIPGRTPRLGDLMLDLAGALVGVISVALVRRALSRLRTGPGRE